MPKRPTESAADRAAPTPRGAGHFTATAAPAKHPTTPRTGAAASVAAAPAPKWEDRNERVTFHCPKDVVEAVEDAMRSTGVSKSRLIVDAIRKHLAEMTAGGS